MTSTLTRQSPIHHLLEPLGGEWTDIAGTSIALRCEAAEAEAKAVQTLALCDVSALPTLGVKGPAAADWLSAHGVAIPDETYDTQKLADGGLVARVASDEFLLQSGAECKTVPSLSDKLGSGQEGAILVERQEATLLLVGARAHEVFLQTCGVDLREVRPGRLTMTRVAGASCGILRFDREDMRRYPLWPHYQLWIDPTYAVYVWETLLEIVEQLEGHVVGAAAVLDGLTTA